MATTGTMKFTSEVVGCHHHGALDEGATKARYGAALPAVGFASRVREQLPRSAARDGGRALDDLCGIGLKVGDQDAEHVGARGAQARGRKVAYVTEVVDDALAPARSCPWRRRSGR